MVTGRIYLQDGFCPFWLNDGRVQVVRVWQEFFLIRRSFCVFDFDFELQLRRFFSFLE